MIPIPLVMGALGRVPWRLVAYSMAAIAVLVIGWRIHAWHESHKALPGVQAALEAEVACADGSECRARENRLQEAVGHETVRIVTGYEAELAALRGRNEVADVEPIRSGSYVNPTTTPVATTTTGRQWFVEANAPDGTLEVREHADYASTILRRVRNGDSVQVTGVRRGDWLEVVQGGWVREDQLRYDRTAIRFS